ncbi:serpin family protein [Coleofasciculus sp. FACHB-T130]|uniref:serpin family protein n=1 Tax=Cyanophyceae TaxID=3028117 RepID=UPI0016881A60|nr:serpin family protein [Coleofasciculus sp. FACHB-T130]MBD1880445.1 serpin family protein [Coleofasciculus sp. FACHB-T130]
MRQFIAGFTAALVGLAIASVGSAMAREPGIYFRNSRALSDKADGNGTPKPILTSQTASTTPKQPTEELSALLDTVVEGNSSFALDLYNRLRKQEGNLFFSPYSISTALAMTYAGAGGQTATEMAKVLHFTLEQERLHPTFAALMAELNASEQQGYQIAVANRLWGQKGYGFSERFLKTTQNDYGGGLQEVDFAGATEQTRRTINNWVAKKTEDKIQDLIAPGTISSKTKLVLTNAIYFKGAWFSPFDRQKTKDEPFYVTPTQQVSVPMMCKTEQYGWADIGSLKVLELPYGQGEEISKELSMVILLPKQADGLAKMEQQLTPKNLERWLSSLKYEQMVEVWVPKFNLTSEFDLSKVLANMGMPEAFSVQADFSAMTGKKGLFISKVIHKAFVEVNEEGTEAAASTGVGMTRGANKEFRADRPFVFLIRDKQSGSILFLGRVLNPLQSTAAVGK